MTVTAASAKKKAPKDGAKKAAKPTHPPTLEMISKAIAVEKDPKGTSVMAIKKYIMAHNQIKSAQFLNHMLRRAFESGLAGGKLTRPKGQAETSLLAGRYRLASGKEKKAKAAVAKPKAAAAKPKKVVKKVAKSPAKKSPVKKATPKKTKAKSPKKPAAKKAKPAAKKSPKKGAPKKKTPKKAGKK